VGVSGRERSAGAAAATVAESALERIERESGGSIPTRATAVDFFIAAIAMVATWEVYLFAYGEPQNYLAIAAGLAGVVGLALTPALGAYVHGLDDRAVATLLERWSVLAVFTGCLAFYALSMYPPTPFDEQVRQAFAFIHGHTYIDAPQSFLEHAQIGAFSYALHPPLPAVLLMPVVAIWGMDTSQTMFSAVIGAIDVALAWVLLGRLGLRTVARTWLTVFFGAGTVLWYESVLGSTWALPMNTAVLFTLAALIELYGDARPLWLGIYAALAALARYDMVLAAPVFALLAWRKHRSIRSVLWMAPGFIAAGIAFIAFNEVRFGTFFDVGVWHIPNVNVPEVFALHYLPGNLYTVFFQPPTVNDTFPYIHPVFQGQAITLTSPAFVLALRPSLKRLETAALGAAAVLVSIPSLVCYANGFAQFGTRHYIPAFPFLLVMMALGMPRRVDQLSKILIGASIFLVAFGVWHVHMWGLA
jgi:hypothetical protein